MVNLVFMAVVRAFTAVSRVILSWRIISTVPSALLGVAVDWPASTDRAAASASRVSNLPAASLTTFDIADHPLYKGG